MDEVWIVTLPNHWCVSETGSKSLQGIAHVEMARMAG